MKPDDHPDSPCVGRCTTLYDDVCRGCGRTMREVADWVLLTEQEKAQVWRRLKQQKGEHNEQDLPPDL